jgi:hypothetical protein
VLVSETKAEPSEEKTLAPEAHVLVSETKAEPSEEKVLAPDTSISNNEDALSPDLLKGYRKYQSVRTLCLVLVRLYHLLKFSYALASFQKL